MMLRKILFVIAMVLGSIASANETPPTGHAIGSAGFNEMLGKQLGADSLKTEQLPDGSFKLTNTVQTVSAHIQKDGVTFDSIGNSKGKGGFTLELTQWGREGKLQLVTSSSIYSKDNIIYHTHSDGLAEKFSNTSDGIRQDFIVATKPQGEGALHVQLKVKGAKVEAKNGGAAIALDSGRRLTYDRLAVTDANGKSIPAQIVVAKNNVIDVIVDDASASYPLTIDPTVGDENWVSMGVTPDGGINYHVVALAVDGIGSLYAGGGFTTAGGMSANYIAKWNGSSWSALGSGMNNDVNALAFDSAGNLYAGGCFTAAGGLSANYIAKWNGSTWSALGSGMNNNVNALAFDSAGNLYAGGNFTTAGGVSANYIAKWNGSSWSALGSGMNNDVKVLAFDSADNLYAGGNFTTAGSVSANYIAKWNGSSWSPLGSGMNHTVNTLAFDSVGNLYAGGLFNTAGGANAVVVAKWNGSSWSRLGAGIDNSFGFGLTEVRTLALDSNDNVYIGGLFESAQGGSVTVFAIAKWDGVNWSALGSSVNNYVFALVVDRKNSLYVGGGFDRAGDKASSNLAKWLLLDTDNDGIGDEVDTDDDNDTVLDVNDKFPLDASRWQIVRHSTDMDGDSDLLTRSASLGTWTRYTIQNAAITGTGSMNAYTSSSVQYVAQLDANGDGDADILTRNTSTGAWYLHQVQSGAVTSTAPIYLYASLDQQFIGTGDFNNDGTDDVMLRSVSAGYYTVFLLANHTVSSTVYYNAWASSSSVPQGIGDFNGDGTDDLLVRRTSDNLYFVFKTTNGAVATSYCACNIWNNPDWTFQFAGDTNKDGIDDIVIRGTGASADGFWWNFRMNNFSSAQTTNLNTYKDKALVSYAANGDYNGDGYTDMLIRVNNGPVYVAKIVNGLVSGSTTLLSNLPSDQVVLK